MDRVRRRLRTGFTGIEILLVLIICGIISAVLPSCSEDPSSGRQTPAPDETSQAVHRMKDAAQTGTAVLRMTREVGAGAPSDAVPSVDPTAIDPASGDELLEILQDLLPAL